MRKHIALLTLLVSGFFLLGAAPAGAANCTVITSGPTAVGGAFFHGANLNGCTDVDAVRFWGSAATNSGWYDSTLSQQFGALLINNVWVYPGPPTYYIQGVLNGPPIANFSAQYQTSCWYGASVRHNLTSSFSYNLHNRQNQSWGPIHVKYGGLTNTGGC